MSTENSSENEKGRIGLQELDHFVPVDKDPYKAYLGQTVEVVSGKASFWGVYRGSREHHRDIVLLPHISKEKTINLEKPGETVNYLRVRYDPEYILDGIVAVHPIREEDIFLTIFENNRAVDEKRKNMEEQIAAEKSSKKKAKKSKKKRKK